MTLAHMAPATPAELIPGLFAVDVMAKQPGTTYFVHLEINAAAVPQRLMDDFAEAGFTPMPYGAPPLERDGVKVLGQDLVKGGSGLFNSWTPTERTANLAEIKAILALHGVKAVPRVADPIEFI